MHLGKQFCMTIWVFIHGSVLNKFDLKEAYLSDIWSLFIDLR